ncbi:hypothetical protein GEMRC1_012962 [Eukaryota sp. GEM-RC1]
MSFCFQAMEYLVSLSWLASNHSDYKMLLDHYLQWRRPPRYVYNFPSTVTSPEEPTCTFTSIDFPKVCSKLAHLKSYVRESDLLTQILQILTLYEQWNNTVDSNDAYFHLVFSCFQLISKARNCRIAFVNEGKDTFYQLFRVVGQNHVKDNNIIPFIVSGQTGSGKSVLTGVVVVMVTLKPIIVCQPRVLPATKLSDFINDLCHSDFPLSGYRTGNKNTNIPVHSPRFIEVQTAAFTSKFLTNNSNLSRFATIMVDEVHERKCDIDILLAQMRIISQTDSKLRVVICSATMDKPNPCFNYLTQGNYLDTEPSYTIHAAGRTNPLIVLDVNFVRQNEFHYSPLISKLVITPIFEPTLQQVFNDHFIDIYTYFVFNVNSYYDYFTQHCNPLSYKSINFRALARLCLCYYSLSQKLFQFEPECTGFTLLVFLPGSPEITTLSNIIENEYETSSEKPGVYPLYSSLDSVQQDAAVAKPAKKQFKIVIVTNIAESSLTIDGVKFVIDCGLSKQTDADDLLDTHHCSIASLDQRSGRAGRNSPGLSFFFSILVHRMAHELQYQFGFGNGKAIYQGWFKQLIAYSNELDIHGSFEVKRVWNVYWPYHELLIESTFGCINRLRILVYLTEQGEVPITVLKSWYDNIIILDFNLLKSNSPPVTVDYGNGRKHHFQLLNFQVNDEQDLLMCFDPACPLCASSCTTLNEVVNSEITLAQHKVEEPMIPENADLPEPMISETTALPQSPVATSTLDLSSWTKSYCTASSHTAKYLGQNVQMLNFTREEMRTFYVVFSFESKIAIGTLNIDNDVVETLHTEFFSAITPTPTPTPVLNVTLRFVVYNIDKELRRFSHSIDDDRPQCKPFDNQLTMFTLHHQLLYQAILIAFEGPIFMIQYKPKTDKRKTIRQVLPLPLARDSFDSQCIDMAAAKIVLLSQRRLCC